jgi:hypothetical protein
MFPKDSWEVNDTVVVNGKHGKIKEFSPDNKKVYVEHKDNENHPYVRWYDKSELPPFGEPTQPLPPSLVKGQRVRMLRDVQSLTDGSTIYKGDEGEVSDYMGTLGFRRNGQTHFGTMIEGAKFNVLDFCEAIADDPLAIEEPKAEENPLPAAPIVALVSGDLDLPDDPALLKEIIREQRRKLNNQSIRINAMMEASKDEGLVQDKLDQLEDDYSKLEQEKAAVVIERDKLAEVNRQQCEMLKQANEVMDAFRIVGKFLNMDKLVLPKAEAVS